MARSRNYVFTVNNYDDEDEHQCWAMPWEVKDCKYICVGKEIGESGTPHLQGYICFTQLKSLNQLKGFFPSAHFETKRGTHQQAADYCKKDGDFFEWGTLPVDDCGSAGAAAMDELMGHTIECIRNGDYKGIPNAATHFIKAAEYRVLKEQQQDRNLATLDTLTHQWRWGKAGCGKSKPARDANPDAYLKMCNKWWDGYTGQEVVIIEDFDPDHKCLVHHLKIWADRYAFPAEVKGGKIDIRPKTIIITSNYHPRDIFDREPDLEAIMRRFNVTHVLGDLGVDFMQVDNS
ncbi:replication-associated protein [Sewage-associated circular DNA virus-20]|uniref:Replication-associated protein n=1 Tax=Sewage-associated circular DNA virus-20 TaxID=1592087 RepID=A0A0B4UGX8_9VIRU|nr:replication-associated protein [Sewage-associated circular DNA virus-20]AJD07533.1 replication-associated protein [Sewage-associated circular DNA virus-20]